MLFKRLLQILAVLVVSGIFCCLLVYINLAGIVESQIKQRLPQFLGTTSAGFEIKKIGLLNSVLSNLYLGEAVSVDGVDLSYEITGFSSVKLGTITINGPVIRASLDENNQIQFKGIDIPAPSSDNTKQEINTALFPEKLVIKQGRLFLTAFSEEFIIPFDALSVIQADQGKIKIQSKLYPFGQKIDAHLVYSIEKGVEQIQINAPSFDACFLNGLLQKTPLKLAGKINVSASSAAPANKWDLSVSGPLFVEPEDIQLKHLKTSLVLNGEHLKARGRLNLLHPAIKETQLKFDTDINFSDGPSFKAHVENIENKIVLLKHGDGTGTLKHPKFKADFSGTFKKPIGRIILKTSSFSFKNLETNLSFSNLNFVNQIKADFSGTKPTVSSKMNLSAYRVSAISSTMEARFPMVSMSGAVQYDFGGKPKGNLRVTSDNGSVISKQLGIDVSEISFSLPYNLSGKAGKRPGSYKINKLVVQDTYRFANSGTIRQTGLFSYKLIGNALFENLTNVSVNYAAALGFEKGPNVDLKFSIPSFNLTYDDIEPFIGPQLQTIKMDLKAGIDGQIQFSNAGLDTKVGMDVSDGQLDLPDSEIRLSGIHTRVDLVDLLKLRSIPGQLLHIDSIDAKKVKIQDAKVRFTIESLSAVLVENIQLKWCNGIVSSEAIRFSKGNKDYQLTLYCDRLEMVQLLNQLGDFKSQGTGTVSGRIPISYMDGDISFNNGFLFTTPGSGGVMAIKNIDQFTKNIPMESAQLSQIAVAQEALKDYQYKWAKLYLNSLEDNLSFRLMLDGRPSKILPFRFKKEMGGFVKVGVSSPGSDFEAISLDIKLNLPFNEVVNFGNKLKSLFNK